jgi:uncharacterized tellurite resistance protein B-like protein
MIFLLGYVGNVDGSPVCASPARDKASDDVGSPRAATLTSRMNHIDDEERLRDVSGPERVDYATVVASLVGADRDVTDAELAPIDELCRELNLAEDERAAVLAGARSPDAARVDAAVARLQRNVALRVHLLTDAIAVVFADGAVAPGESEAIERLAHALEIPRAQIGLIARYVESVILERDDELSRTLDQGVASAGRTAHPGLLRRIYRRFRR